VPVARDSEWRRREAVTRAAVALLDDGGLLPESLGLLPSEPSIDLDDALDDLSRLLKPFANDQSPPDKKSKTSPTPSDDVLHEFIDAHKGQCSPVPEIDFESLREEMLAGPLEIAESEGSVGQNLSLDRCQFMRRLLNSIDFDAFVSDL
jgi:hypothetical protein